MKPFPCPQWSDCGTIGSGCCSLGLFGGKPSRGTCAMCVRRPPSNLSFNQLVFESDAVPAAMPSQTIQEVGPVLWRQLHTSMNVPASVELVTRSLPCGECRIEWRKILAAMPPDFSTREAFFVWTWMAHNAVNQRLGKVEMGLEAASAIWRC